MTRLILFSLCLLGLIMYLMLRLEVMYNEAQPPIVTRVDVLSDRITYRTGVYRTTSAFAIGLKASVATDPPDLIELHDCDRREQLQAVLELLRAEGVHRFDIVLPESC